MRMRALVVAILVFATLPFPRDAGASFRVAKLLFNLKDTRIGESSGVASSAKTPGVLFTHNDSGDTARFFAVGPKGQTLVTFDIQTQGSVDMEDMAAGRTYSRDPALFFADIGDNYRARPFVVVYEVPEPEVDIYGDSAVVTPHGVTLLLYEDGPHDAETMFLVERGRRIGIVTKEANGQSGVYLEEDVAGTEGEIQTVKVALLRRVATIRFDKVARPYQKGDFSRESRLMTTGGDVSPDGKRFVVRTYVEAFEWDISKGLVNGLKKRPVRIPLPRTKQGEAIAYAQDGRSLVTTSEQLPAPVHLVPAA